MRSIILLMLFVGLTVTVPAADKAPYFTPPVGSALRKQLMDTVRIPAEEHLGQAVVFKVSALRVDDNWAFFLGTAIQPNGNPVDFRKSKAFRDNPRETKSEIEAGMLYGGVTALLKKEGNRWRVVTITYDASDVHWLDYGQKYGAPHRMISDVIR